MRAVERARTEVRFVGRLLWIIVLWSIVGGVVGAVLGAAIVWAGIGGGGRLAAILQIVGWAIFGHLIAGMWAGYALLADRSNSEFTPDSGGGAGEASVVRVHCRHRDEIERTRELLDASGAIDIEVIADARQVVVKKP